MMKMITKNVRLGSADRFSEMLRYCCSLMLLLVAPFAFGQNQTCYTIDLNAGSYPGEISWNLKLGDELITSGGAPIESEELCLIDGCYSLEMMDSFDDGWNGAELSFSLDGEVVLGPFSISGGTEIANITIGDVVCSVPGCIDESALNFNPDANEDDGSCEYPTIVDIDCEQVFSPEPYCYVNNEASAWLYIGEEDATLNLSFLIGSIEGSTYDNITIYDGDSDAADMLYTSEGLGYGVDISAVSVNSTGNAIFMTVYSDGSYSCADGLGGFGEWDWEVSCGASYDCPEASQNIGETCDDGDPLTYDDIRGEDCGCAGTPFDCTENPEAPANIGDLCDDNDPLTYNDIVGEDCGCVGTSYDCTENPEAPANFGDLCDDNDESTFDDVIGEDCMCAGNSVPDNDECDDAFLLLCGVTTEGNTSLASPAPEGLAFCGAGSTTAPGVWYSYFSMASNPTIISLEGSSFDTKLFVYTGLCGELECLAGNDDFHGTQSQVSFDAMPGTYYSVFVTGFSSASGDYSISINCGYDCDEFEAYIGDECDDENEGTYDDVYNDECGCEGTPYECQELLANVGDACENAPGFENSVVTEDCGCVGTEIPPAPENDLICDAAVVACGDVVEGTTVDATFDDAGTCGTSNTAPGVWYNLPIDFDGSVTLSMCNTASYDTKISVFNADDCGSELACIGGNDDGELDGVDCGLSSSFELDVNAGQNLFVLVHGFSSGTGDFTLAISCVEGLDCENLGLNFDAPCDAGPGYVNGIVTQDCECVGDPIPSNDLICGAAPIACGDTLEGTTVGASHDEGIESCNFTSNTAPGVWYVLNADFDGSITASLCEGTDFDSKMSIFSADDCNGELVCVGGNDDACSLQSAVTADITAGTYYILVHGFSSNVGAFGISLDCVIPVDCEELGLNIGDECDDQDPMTENDIVDENCGCAGTPIEEPTDCQNWAMFMNDNEGGETDVYGVDLSSGDAELTFLVTLDFHAHIAYNPTDNMLYVVNNNGSSYVIVNPHVSPVTVSAPVMLADDMPSITTAAFAPNGKLLIGSATQDIIHSVDVSDNSVSVYDAYAPISGGDIAFRADGKPYLASRSGNGLYEIWPEGMMMDDQYLGSIDSHVTGMTFTADDKIITSHNGNADLHLYNSADGSSAGVSFPLMLDGEAFDHNNGDLAAGCNSYSNNEEGDCELFNTFYADINRPGVSGTDIYGVAYTGAGNAEMTYLTSVTFSAHIAYNAEDDILYIVNQNGSMLKAYDPTSGSFIADLPLIGAANSSVAIAYNPADGLLYVGSNNSQIKTVDLGTGVASNFATGPVSGGDLAFQDGKLYLATRNGSNLHEITGGGAVLVGSIPTLVNGMAQANNSTDLIMANKNAGVFTKVSAADGSTVGTYVPMIDGEAVTLYDGDMAAGCGDDQPVVIPEGECYATEVFEYIEGAAMGGGSIPAERADASQALGAPERTDEMVFVALGYGGSLTVGFGGSVPNAEGDDIEIVETSFNSAGCDAYPEYVSVYVSLDGIDWHFAADSVCKANPFVDISDAGDFDYVMYVKVVNDDDATTSSDGLDVDGIVALHNCEEDGSENGESNDLIASTSVMTSFPNPTTGPSQVVFTTALTGRTLVEVYDMNGRNVETLFNQVAQSGQEYRIDFNGNNLPNGVYIYKMTTNNETIVNKFMIAE